MSSLKEVLKALRHSEFRGVRFVYRTLRGVYKPLQFVLDPRFRSVVILGHRGGPELHQVSNMTWLDRYPDVFSALASLLEEHLAPRLLSYGCSTGQEVVTLRRYFPAARICGVDINPWNLKMCRALVCDSRIRFARPDDPDAYCEAPYDAILCMAVLQRPKNRDPKTLNSSEIYPFDKFDGKLEALDALLVVGGFLIVDGADYRFSDASIACRYEPVAGTHGISVNRPVYSKDNLRLERCGYSERIFQKLRAGPAQ